MRENPRFGLLAPTGRKRGSGNRRRRLGVDQPWLPIMNINAGRPLVRLIAAASDRFVPLVLVPPFVLPYGGRISGVIETAFQKQLEWLLEAGGRIASSG